MLRHRRDAALAATLAVVALALGLGARRDLLTDRDRRTHPLGTPVAGHVALLGLGRRGSMPLDHVLRWGGGGTWRTGHGES
ncbi:MAG: hypothetical protein M3424_06230 [Actinomycetota bacterium]|nr:hypothetical protein [Actinomycetota bacterium]